MSLAVQEIEKYYIYRA